jgi:hypothetical protein
MHRWCEVDRVVSNTQRDIETERMLKRQHGVTAGCRWVSGNWYKKRGLCEDLGR